MTIVGGTIRFENKRVPATTYFQNPLWDDYRRRWCV